MQVFGNLENSKHIHMTFAEGVLEVELPRLNLSFFMNQDDAFECKELRMLVAKDQSLKTLIGLKSRLVLCGLKAHAQEQERIVLIPIGELVINRTQYYTSVRITTNGRNVRLFRYDLDAILCRLDERGDIIGSLYKSLLHAVTSHVLPDPLTSRTGVEEALSCLKQRSTAFTEPPGEEAVRLLNLISSLTPVRNFYPRHLRLLQDVQWNPELSMLVQHDDFAPLAERILASGNRYTVFYPRVKEALSLSREGNADLSLRARLRNSKLWGVDCGGERFENEHDSDYKARDQFLASERASKVYEIASLVLRKPQRLQVSSSLEKDLREMGNLSGFRLKFDTSQALSETLKTDFASSFGPLLVLCRSFEGGDDIYPLLFQLSTIAYCENTTSLEMLRTLLAFAFVPELKTIPIPSEPAYFDLESGEDFNENGARKIFEIFLTEYRPPTKQQRTAQSSKGYDKFKKQCNDQITRVVAFYRSKWPCTNPAPPSQQRFPNLRIEDARQDVSDLFAVRSGNRALRVWLKKVQRVLSRVYQESFAKKYVPIEWQSVQEIPKTPYDTTLPSLLSLTLRNVPILPPKPPAWIREQIVRDSTKKGELQGIIAAL